MQLLYIHHLDVKRWEFEIIEADNNNIVPTVSSVLFLILTDLLGVELSEKNNFKKEDFKKNHPCGLGSQI